MHCRWKRCLILLVLCPLVSFATNLSFKQGIHRILKKANPNLNMGIVVVSTRDGKILYKRNASHLYTPASIQKLFTTTAALYFLKPNFRFLTQLYINGDIRKGVLHGDVSVKFNGDPTFTSKNLANLLHHLKSKGIHRIAGHVYLDTRAYSHLPYPPGWIWDDLSYSFAAPLGTIIINSNKFQTRFIPAKHNNKPPKIIPDLPPQVAHFTNHMTTTRTYRKNCPVTIYSDDSNHYTFSGCLDRRVGVQRRDLAIRDVVLFTKAIIKADLRQDHIRLSGSIEVHAKPANATIIAVHQSKPLTRIVKKILKESDNLYTNSLLKKIGELYFHKSGSWKSGLKALKKILSPSTRINFKHNLLNDGAGLSRYNLITPLQISKLLYMITHNPLVNHAITKALPIVGTDGTMIDRMRKFRYRRRILAKTGSMTGVSSLAGYINSLHNGKLAYVIMINGFVGKIKPYHQLENQLVEWFTTAPKAR